MALGAFAEWATGMGTSFGLGMYLPTPATFPMLIGGAYRSWWEERRLKPIVESVREDEGSAAAEKRGAQMLLFTFMIAAGALTGEAFYGVEAAILAVLDESALGTNSWWPYARIAGFILINVLLGALVYALFRSAGIIGSRNAGTPPSSGGQAPVPASTKANSGVMDAELAD